MNKNILRKDQHAIDNATRDLRYNLQTAQKYLDWYNSIEFTPELKTIDEVKEFLDSPQELYGNSVKKHLTELTGLKTLPPDIEPFKKMYQIPECQAWSVSDEFGFDYLQMDKKGTLSYLQELYNQIEAENTFFATPEQSVTLNELDRTYNNCMQLCETFAPSETHKNLYKQAFEKAFQIIVKEQGWNVRPDGNFTKWDLEKLEKLSKSGFGLSKKSLNHKNK